MEGAPTCQCNMFKVSGTCYHTGYKPRLRDTPVPEPFSPVIGLPPVVSDGQMLVYTRLRDFRAYLADLEAARQTRKRSTLSDAS